MVVASLGEPDETAEKRQSNNEITCLSVSPKKFKVTKDESTKLV